MKNRDVAALTDKYIAKTYARAPIALVKGKGTKVWDANGKEYLDFLAGIAVNSLGHCNPAIVKAIKQQAQKLLHVSNLYHIQPQAESYYQAHGGRQTDDRNAADGECQGEREREALRRDSLPQPRLRFLSHRSE